MSIGWGVVGAGGIADRRTIPEGIIPARNGTLEAIMEPVPDRLAELRDKYSDAAPCETLDELLARDGVQAVYIASPPKFHAEQAIAAARAGRHVLVEKPMAMTTAECERMIAACETEGVKLGVGFMMRYHGCHQRIKQMLSDGLLGAPVMGRAELTCWYPPIKGAFRQILAEGGGGAFMDMGNHCIDLLEMLFGRTTEIALLTANLVQDYEAEDTSVATLRFEGGAVGIIDAHFNIPDAASRNMLEVYGSAGSVTTQGTIGQMSTGSIHALLQEEAAGYDAQQEREPCVNEQVIEPEPVNMYQAQIEDLGDAVAEGRAPGVSGEDGLWNHRVVLAAYESAKTGKMIRPG
ncbi:MAG: Gfo/Idh/MocA family protein [Armatimonadota bacterium]